MAISTTKASLFLATDIVIRLSSFRTAYGIKFSLWSENYQDRYWEKNLMESPLVLGNILILRFEGLVSAGASSS